MSHPVTNYNYIEDTKESVSIKKTNANKCALSEIFLSEILKSFSTLDEKILTQHIQMNYSFKLMSFK